MKTQQITTTLLGIILTISLSLPGLAQESERVLMLVNPQNKEMMEELNRLGLKPYDPTNQEALRELRELDRKPLNRRHERLSEQAYREQELFLERIDQFLDADFDPQDPEAYPDFMNAKKDIVDIVFNSYTERHFYQRLYLINDLWLENMDEVDRFDVLDQALREEWLDRAEQRKKIREIIISVSAAGGAIAGGYFSFKRSQKVFTVSAGESLGFFKGLGRTFMIVVGAGVGAAAGSYVGFLGSDYLLSRQFEYVAPIDGNQDLREILDVIDQLP